LRSEIGLKVINIHQVWRRTNVSREGYELGWRLDCIKERRNMGERLDCIKESRKMGERKTE
jgi:hypothetical protein